MEFYKKILAQGGEHFKKNDGRSTKFAGGNARLPKIFQTSNLEIHYDAGWRNFKKAAVESLRKNRAANFPGSAKIRAKILGKTPTKSTAAMAVTGNAKERNQFPPVLAQIYSRNPPRQAKSTGRKIIGRNRGNSSGSSTHTQASAMLIIT